jgi:dTDP-glucose pyrophosphorylase
VVTPATSAVILARGLGTRMQRPDVGAPLTAEQARAADAGTKAMMPVGRPFLDHVLASLADAGITRACLVVAPDHEAMHLRYTRDAVPTRFSLQFAVQEEPRGTADALLAARPFMKHGQDPFLVVNADNLYGPAALAGVAAAGGSAVAGHDREALVAMGNIGQERIRRYALLRCDARGFLEDIVEKPDEATFEAMGPHAPVSMNLWAFTPAILEACERVVPSERGELELPDAVRIAIRDLGVQIRVVPVREGVLDLATRGDVAAVAERLARADVRL